MTSPDLAAGLRALAAALPAETPVPVPAGVLLELLSTNGASAPIAFERMLTAGEVAGLLSTTERWIYAHADQLGGKRLSRRCLRFPESAIRRRTERRP